MGKRSRKRARNDEPTGLPAGFEESWNVGLRLAAELRGGVSFEEAISTRREQLRDLVARFDAVHLLGHIAMGESQMNPETYRESEHRGLAYVIEMLAGELLIRPDRAGRSAPTPALDATISTEVRRLIQEATHLESFRRYMAAGGLASPEASARGRAASHHLMMRAPGWPWQEDEVLRGLFGPSHIAQQLRSTIGFDAETAIACSDAIAESFSDRLHAHGMAAMQDVAGFGPGNEAYEWASASLGGWQEAPGSDAFKARAMTALWATNHIGEAFVVDGRFVSDRAGVTEAAATAFLDALSVQFGQSDGDWFALAERVRYRPYIDLGNGSFMPTVPGNDLWTLRLLFEKALKDSEPYRAHRGQWLETKALSLLEAALDPDEVHEGLDFSYEDESGTVVEGEIDGLLRLGDTALVVEAKSATLKPGARRGGAALIDHLRKNVTKAATQSDKAREALRRGDCFTKNGKPLALDAQIREVHPIVVTLDDYSSVAPVIWQFAGTRVMPPGTTVPWVVTVYELDLVCATIGWPAQFVHFLRRRARLNERGGLSATDELDWWMHYLEQGLYFEDEDDGPIRLASFTDPLDAWVLYNRGIRKTAAPKPAMKLDKSSVTALEYLHKERPDGWVAAVCTLLEPAGVVRKDLWKRVQQLRRKARERDKVQRATLGFNEGPVEMMIINVVVPDTDSVHVGDHLEACIAERVDEHGLQRVLGLGHIVSSKRPYDALAVLEHAWWEKG